MKRLDAIGKGEANYDFKYDILLFKIQDRNYKKSIELGDIVADVDEEGFVTGIQIFDASRHFDIPKYALRKIPAWSFDTEVNKGKIRIDLRFKVWLRNKVKENVQHHLIARAPTNTKDSIVQCALA